ncbi:hypothetical protein [Sphingomonas xinjiangensis]|uniref:Uncharacterized protein n=1 Tax=Sphingomonas xinjiangensis TaxID=643568 RepID=A0A840YNY8_9SPHN|nr:hypothetical protein [Sphingomonas xinjiangensis]MBB5709352.1 hypothetical protein [Sphingomonas xinjiangensis]
MRDLGSYLLEAAKTPWKDGVHDCSAWPARWAGIETPAYSSMDEAQALIDAAGGLVPLWEQCIAGRLERVETPEAGDVGIIEAIGADRQSVQIGAIWTGKRWAFLSPTSLVSASAEAIAIWRRPCPRP